MGEDPDPTTSGDLLAGRYRLTARLGRGSSADVFGARDEVLQRDVAVKVFRFDTTLGENRRRVEAEVRLLSSLQHPGLVTVFDARTVAGPGDEGTPFLVMELVDGPTVSQQLDTGPMSTAEVAELGRAVSATLAHIHAAGVVHRDVKPANILLAAPTSGQAPFAAKLTDFGIARMIDSTRLTMDGMTVGTPNYLSPEQAQGWPSGPAGDVYALGLVLIECLTGELAFPGVGVETALARLRQQPAIPTLYGPGWSRLLACMTEREPEARATAAELTDAFSRLDLPDVGSALPTDPTPTDETPTDAPPKDEIATDATFFPFARSPVRP